MENTRTRKLLLTMITSVIYQIVSGVGGFILPRLIILHYGSAYNGTLSSILQFLSIVAFLRLGIAGALRVSLYGPLAKKDTNAISEIVNGTQLYMHKIAYIIMVYVIILIFFYPLIINNPQSYIATSILVFALGVGTFAEYFFGMTYGTLLIADQRLYILHIVQTLTTLINIFVSVWLILTGHSIQVIKLVSAVLFFMSPLILNQYVSRKYHINKRALPNCNVLVKRKDAMGHSIANIIHENIDIILLTVFCGVKVVSIYAVYSLVMTSLRKILIILTEGTEAVFGNFWVQKEYNNIKKYMSCYEWLISSFIVVAFSATGLLLLPFIRLYTKGVSDVQYYIPSYALVITLAYFFYCMRTPYVTVVQAVGHYKETKKGAYMEAFINLFSSLILVQFLGLIGTAIGTLLANVFRTAQYAFYVKKNLIVCSITKNVRRLLWIIGNMGIIILLCYFYTVKTASIGWYNWILCGIFIVTVGTILVLCTSCLFYKNDIKCIIDIIFRLRKKYRIPKRNI